MQRFEEKKGEDDSRDHRPENAYRSPIANGQQNNHGNKG
jgi:hypothetical protein